MNKINAKTANLPHADAGGEIVLYRTEDGTTHLEVRLKRDTLWMDVHQMAALFQRDRSVLLRHIHNIYKTKELDAAATCAKNAQVAADGRIRLMDFYNLDVIIAVGYKVNSKRGTQFRIWATLVLKDHILKGFSLNEKRLREENARLRELHDAVDLMGRILEERRLTGREAEGLLKVITDYSLALRLLDDYDHQRLSIHTTTETARFMLTYETARSAIDRLAGLTDFPAAGLFGREKDASFKSALGAIYQTFGGHDLYPCLEEKAAHLLYFVVKNHAFVDGNKRIGAFLFIWFLDANGLLYRKDGSKRVADNALVALTLLIAESRPSEKNTIIKVIVNLINRENH
jgi:prophage maintenance system killer protein